MSRAQLGTVRQWPLFAGMSQDSFDALMRGAYLKTFPVGFELFTEGDPAEFLHVLIEGRVELHASWEGRETTMALITPGATFILAAVIRNAPNLMSARTLERSRIVLLPAEDVRALAAADRTFSAALMDELARCYRASIRHAKDIKLRSAPERVANWILRQSHRRGGAQRFSLPVEKRRIAGYLGITAESFSRALAALSAHGVRVDGSEVLIEDRARLEAWARPSPLLDFPEDPARPGREG